MKHFKSPFGLILCLAVAIILTNVLTMPLPLAPGSHMLRTLADSPIAPISPLPQPSKDDSGKKPNPAETGGVIPGQGGENYPITDPDAPRVTVIFPSQAVSVPIQVKIYESGVFDGMAVTGDNVGSPFVFGVWPRLNGEMITQFNRAIHLYIQYDEANLSNEQQHNLRLFMYDPTIEAWIKVGGKVDTYRNIISALLTNYTPYEQGMGAMFVVAADNSPLLSQAVSADGTTTLTLEESGIRFHVPPGTVPPKTHFEVTEATLDSLPAVAVRAYRINHSSINSDLGEEFTNLPKAIYLEFQTPNNPDNLTILTWHKGQWVKPSVLGSKVTYTEDTIIIETTTLGTFAIAVMN